MALLRDQGYEVKGAHNGRDALAALAEFEPHALICDIAMPDVSGWDIARAVREVRAGARNDRPLLIAMSGIFNKGADRILAEIAGFNYFLPKPFDPNVLLRLLPRVKPETDRSAG